MLLQGVSSAVDGASQMPFLERLWKYAVLGATSILFEEANPIFGGIAARHARLGVLGVIIAVAVGTWIPSIALYFVGRWRIAWVRARWPERQRMLDGALAIVSAHPWRASLAIRFAYGLRLPLPIACGAARLSPTLYVIASGISCCVWSIAFTLLGWKAGGAALRLLGVTTRYDVRLGFVAVALTVWLVVIRRRRRIAERTAHILSGEHIPIMTTAERKIPRKRP